MSDRRKVLELFEKNKEYMEERVTGGIEQNRKGYAEICVKDKDGNIIGFGVLVPSIAKALKKSNGKLFPLGIFRMLKALKCKNDTLEMFFVAVLPEYQSLGVPAILINTLAKIIIKNGVKYCETGPMLETNTAVHSMWRHFDKRQHRRRRCYIKGI